MSDHQQCRSAPRPFVGSMALLRRIIDEAEEWLAVWDDDSERYLFPQAERGDGETYRSCLEAAVATTFGLDQRRDFIISGLSRAHYQAPVDWGDDFPPQWVIVQFFPVELYGRRGAELIAGNDSLRWLALDEVYRGETRDGARIAYQQCELIRRADLIPPKFVPQAT